jgi:hypothetical protein
MEPAVLRGMVSDSLVLSVAGALLGIGLAHLALRALMALIPEAGFSGTAAAG